MHAGRTGSRGEAGHAAGVDLVAGSEVSRVKHGFRAEHHPTLLNPHAME